MVNKQICPDWEQPVEKLDFVPVDGSYIKVLITRMALVYMAFMACALIIPLLAERHGILILVIAEALLTAAFTVNVTLTRRIYKIRGYALRSKDISYRAGLFFTSVTTIPFSKIQQVSIRMNPVSRLFGLCYLDIINGSQAAMNQISIPGLKHDDAEKIKWLLINRADCDHD